MKIKEVIVVEGKHDSQTIRRYVDADTIETQGTGLTDAVFATIAQMQSLRGIIILTDPDSPGDAIRHQINQRVPGCKNAFLASKDARYKHKVGVEHASEEVILEALRGCITYTEEATTLSWEDYLALGCQGQPDSRNTRLRIGHAFHLGEANAKTLYKRLNMARLTREIIAERLEQADD